MHNEHSYKTCNKCKALNLDINQGGVMGLGQGIYHRSDIPHSTIKHKSHMLDKRAVPAPCASAAAGWWPSAPSSSPPPSACWAWWPSVRPWPPPPCPDIRCGRKTHRHVWVLEDSKFVFQTQRRKVPLYQDNTRCSVRAAPPPMARPGTPPGATAPPSASPATRWPSGPRAARSAGATTSRSRARETQRQTSLFLSGSVLTRLQVLFGHEA